MNRNLKRKLIFATLLGIINFFIYNPIGALAEFYVIPVSTDKIKTVQTTVINANGSKSDSTVGYTYELMRIIGNFSKLYSNSNLMVTWTSHGSVTGRFCDFQVRIDGISDNGSTGTTGFQVDGSGRAVIGEVNGDATSVLGDSFTVVTIFQGISAGNHDVEIWLRGDADNCTLNTGNFAFRVIIEEFISRNGINGLTASDGPTRSIEDSSSEVEPLDSGMAQ